MNNSKELNNLVRKHLVGVVGMEKATEAFNHLIVNMRQQGQSSVVVNKGDPLIARALAKLEELNSMKSQQREAS